MSSAFTFHGELSGLLRPRWRTQKTVIYPVNRQASIKDVVESLGVPHTEIGRLECNNLEVDFSFQLENNRYYDIYGIETPWDVTKPTLLRPSPLKEIAFIGDITVGRLAKYLRMAGFDTRYNYQWDDSDILEMLENESRIVLTRNLGLLKRKQVAFGRYVRAEEPRQQLAEIISFFNLTGAAKPFSRCLDCNSLLQRIDKDQILYRLEPLTRKYFTAFSICPSCDKIYWPGSHRCRMEKLLSEIERTQSQNGTAH